MPRKLGWKYRIYVVTAVSLAIGFAALEFDTFRTGYVISYGFAGYRASHPWHLLLFANRGTLHVGWEALDFPDPGWHHFGFRPYKLEDEWLGFVWARYPGSFNLPGVPFWFLSCIAAFFAWRFSKRRKTPGGNLCRQCGYDLRATPDRCPECGTAPDDAKPAAA
jgi:hypothetical protein